MYRAFIAVALILAACGNSQTEPTPTGPFYTPLTDAPGIARIEVTSPLDSTATPQQPMNLDDALHLSPGVWPFHWTAIAGAERYVLYVFDFTGSDAGGEFVTLAEVTTTENAATVELPPGGPYVFEVAAFDGFTLVGKSDAWALQVR